MKKHSPILWIIILAAILRLWGIHHGYPYSYYPDEVHFVKRALSFGSFDFNPHWFHKPALYMYLLFFEYGLFFIFGKIVGLWASVTDFAVSYIINPGPFYIIGRLTTVCFSLGSIFITYKIGQKHFDKKTGLFAALFLALSYGHVSSAQDIKADSAAMFFTALSLLFLLNYVGNARLPSLLAAAIAAGAGTATKTYPVIMLAPIMLAIALHSAQQLSDGTSPAATDFLKKAALSMGAFTMTFFLCSPYNFIDPLGREQTFGFIFRLVDSIRFFLEGSVQKTAEDAVMRRTDLLGGIISYSQQIISDKGMGMFTGVAASIGFVFLLRKMSHKKSVFLVYPVLFAAISIVLFPGYAEPRHQLPLYPFIAVMAGYLCFLLLNAEQPMVRKIFFLSFVIGLSYNSLSIIQRAVVISQPDTRTLAKEWIEKNIPPGTKILIDENGPQLMNTPDKLEKTLAKARNSDPKGQFTAHYGTYLSYQIIAAKKSITYDIEEIRFPWWRDREVQSGVHELTSALDKDCGNPLKPVGVNPYQYYVDNDFKYAIVHSQKYRPFLRNASDIGNRFPSFNKFYNTLFSRGKLIKEFSPAEGASSGVTVKIMQFR